MVPLPGGYTAPLPPTAKRKNVYFRVEDPEQSESSVASSELQLCLTPSSGQSGRALLIPAVSATSLPSALHVAIKTKPLVSAAQRGHQLAGKFRGGGSSGKSASHSLSLAVDSRKRAAEPPAGAAKLRVVATLPSQHISNSSQDGSGSS